MTVFSSFHLLSEQLVMTFSLRRTATLVPQLGRQSRGVIGDIFHDYQKVKHRNVDAHTGNQIDNHIEYQRWLTTEQWHGYSDAYLKRQIMFNQEHFGGYFHVSHMDGKIGYDHSMYTSMQLIFNTYGAAAKILEQLEDDILHPNFHALMKDVVRERKEIETVIDKEYPQLHPTHKIHWDTFVVRRYYFLEDWMDRLKAKRKKIFSHLTPETISAAEKMSHLAELYISRLKVLDGAMRDDPTVGLISDNLQYSEEELAILQSRAKFYRSVKKVNAFERDMYNMP